MSWVEIFLFGCQRYGIKVLDYFGVRKFSVSVGSIQKLYTNTILIRHIDICGNGFGKTHESSFEHGFGLYSKIYSSAMYAQTFLYFPLTNALSHCFGQAGLPNELIFVRPCLLAKYLSITLEHTSGKFCATPNISIQSATTSGLELPKVAT